MSWMFDITGCVVQVAADKAKQALDEKEEALARAKKAEEVNQPKPDSNDKAPTSEAAKKKARDARKKQQIQTANAELATKADQASKLVEAARNSERRSTHRSNLNAPGSQQQKKPTAATKKAAVTNAAAKEAAKKPSAAEPVVSRNTTVKKRPAAEPVVSKNAAGKKRPAAEPVVSKKTKRPKSPGDQMANLRANLIILNPTAGKKTNVAKGTRVQIRYGRYGTLYNAKVTEVLNDGRVMVCTQDEDTDIAETEFKVVRLTEEQAKSSKAHGFIKGCANVGFAVAGANDY